VEGSCDHGNESSGSIQCENSCAVAQLAAYQEELSSVKLVTYLNTVGSVTELCNTAANSKDS
jgi:hypothetical protein